MAQALIPQLLKQYKLHLSVRDQAKADTLATAYKQPVFVTGDLNAESKWSHAVQDVDVVIHLAARVHYMKENKAGAYLQYHRANVAATMALAKAALRAGVKRFIYISTIKVLGERTEGDAVFSDHSKPNPLDDYARSKYQAEHELSAFAKKNGMELVILRPPLMYGPGVKANFLKLIGLVRRGIPLPLGKIKNARSMLYVGNFADAICQCVENKNVVGKTFCITDSDPISTGELVKNIAQVMHKTVRLIPIPVWLLKTVATLLGANKVANRLMESLKVDGSGFVSAVQWRPPYTIEEALNHTVDN